ncbi:hypothetical protein DL98DRAFT_656476 [Cadophora sp. DSE1049]|nr:hypothetical protein DL98DRAFT_656476 [Cadophora sp. DSE1049]
MRSFFSPFLVAAILASFASGIWLEKSTRYPTVPTVNNFRPLPSTNDYDDVVMPQLPLAYDINISNSCMANASNSWWTSTYLTGSDSHDYMVVSHVTDLIEITMYRASVLDITDNIHFQWTNMSLDPNLFESSQNGEFNITIGDNFNFGSTLPGNATQQLRTMLNVPESGVQYDLTFDITAPKILNTGIGGFFAFGSARTAQWSMPSGRTTGSLTRNGTVIYVDSDKSFTWYDRQWNISPSGGAGTPPTTWTWSHIH